MGDTASEYSPYIGNLQYPPSFENMCPVVSSSGSIRVEGANLIPLDFTDISAWELLTSSEGNNRRIKTLDLLPGKYVFSFNAKPLTTYMFLYLQRIDANGNSYTLAHPIMNESVTNRITFEVLEGYTYRFWSWRFAENIALFSDFMLRRINTPNKFHKAKPIINTEIPTLRGIEVTAEDNYNYSENFGDTERYYVSDVLKGNKIIRHIGEKVFTGNEMVAQVDSLNESLNTFTIDLSDIFEGNKNLSPAICNFFGFLGLQNAQDEGIILGKGDKKLYFNLNKEKFTTVDVFVKWLKARYNGNNPLKLCYVLDKPVTEELDAEKSLKSYPEFTKIILKNQNVQMPLGISKIIKVQN